MKAAIREAKKAWALGEVPIGCVIVYEDKIIGRGYNRRMVDHSALAHAEIAAIKKACKRMGDWRLEECELYVTLEPCPMCAGAIVQARIPKVYIGSMNPKAGCAGSVLNLLDEKGFNHQVETEEGLLGEECSMMLKEFFKELREKRKKKKEERIMNNGCVPPTASHFNQVSCSGKKHSSQSSQPILFAPLRAAHQHYSLFIIIYYFV